LAKAAASVDRLSGGRLVLGLASGDRPVEFPAYGLEHAQRGERFAQGLDYSAPGGCPSRTAGSART
ncbi:LLM class flavin-dependent oxidoreductase, partial [Escherichia coli]|uniref:LLM class flavin-dependent oxidoreductase n=1 Tax=Escherichia coli TaxID=562 RepID=UPI001BD384DF